MPDISISGPVLGSRKVLGTGYLDGFLPTFGGGPTKRWNSRHGVSPEASQGDPGGVRWSNPRTAQAEPVTVIGSRLPAPPLPTPELAGREVIGQEPSGFWVFSRKSRALRTAGAFRSMPP